MTWNGRVHQFMRMLELGSVRPHLHLIDLDFVDDDRLGSCARKAADAIEADWEMSRSALRIVLAQLMNCLSLESDSRDRFERYVETQLDQEGAWQALVAWSNGLWTIAYRPEVEASRSLGDELRKRAASIVELDLPEDRWWGLLNEFETTLASGERDDGIFLSYLIRRRALERIWSSLERELSNDERDAVRRAVEVEAFRVNALRTTFSENLPDLSDAVPLLAAK